MAGRKIYMKNSNNKSDNKLKFPHVAYLTMSNNQMWTKNTIISALNQNYPNELKTIYLLHQPPYPPHITHSLPIEIKEINVGHIPWPIMWFFKLDAFLEACTEDYIVWFDEDDRYEPDYTRKALAPVFAGDADVTWNHHMTFIERVRIRSNARYTVPTGTTAGKTEMFRAAVEVLRKKFPHGYHGKRPKSLDPPYAAALQQCGRVVSHDGIRYYFYHSGAYTKRRNPAIENVDYVPRPGRNPNKRKAVSPRPSGNAEQILPFAGQRIHNIQKTLPKSKSRKRG